MRDCAEDIVNLATMTSNESSADLAISAIIPRSDNEVLAVKVSGVNKILKTFCNQNGWGYVEVCEAFSIFRLVAEKIYFEVSLLHRHSLGTSRNRGGGRLRDENKECLRRRLF